MENVERFDARGHIGAHWHDVPTVTPNLNLYRGLAWIGVVFVVLFSTLKFLAPSVSFEWGVVLGFALWIIFGLKARKAKREIDFAENA